MTYQTIIEPGRTERNYWRDLWRFRELFYFLAWRDILVRYKQTVVGIAWAVIRPFLTMIIFTVVFGRVARLPSDGLAPYALMVFAGMLPWQFFSTALTESSTSLVSNSNLITKVYFPRLIVPASSVMISLVDFAITFIMLLGMMAWYAYTPDWHLIAVPLFLLLAVGLSFGAGVWLCAVTVRYRDVRFVLPFVSQLGLFVSPVGFSSTVVPAEWRFLYSLNPMVGIIDGFRWAVLRGEVTLYWPALTASLVWIIVLGLLGLRYFRKTEKSFADVI